MSDDPVIPVWQAILADYPGAHVSLTVSAAHDGGFLATAVIATPSRIGPVAAHAYSDLVRIEATEALALQLARERLDAITASVSPPTEQAAAAPPDDAEELPQAGDDPRGVRACQLLGIRARPGSARAIALERDLGPCTERTAFARRTNALGIVVLADVLAILGAVPSEDRAQNDEVLAHYLNDLGYDGALARLREGATARLA